MPANPLDRELPGSPPKYNGPLLTLSGFSRTLSEVRLLSPVANPTKIIGTPANYRAHAAEAQADAEINVGKTPRTIEQQGLFLKANSALIGPSEGVAVRFPDGTFWPSAD